MTTSAYEAGQIPPVLLRHRLRIAREFAGYEQEELAELIGVSRNTIGNAELGRVAPRRITLRAWAFHCSVPLSWIEGGDAMPHPPQGDAEKEASPSNDRIIDIPRRARILVMEEDGSLNEEATRQIGPTEGLEKPVILRLTAECSARLSYRGLSATLPYGVPMAA
jgi:transcriptional regulator with XRE-family HTH domain